jgi:hypothetical protein
MLPCQGKTHDAEVLAREAMEGMCKELGDSHVGAADCMVALAQVLR